MATLGEFPKPLGRLAVVWIVVGLLSLLRFLHLRVDLGWGGFDIRVLGIVFGPGLFLAQPWARRWLIWLTRAGFLVAGIFTLGVLSWSGRALWAGLCVSALLFVLLLIQRNVLMRPDVQRFFDPYGRVV